MERNSSLKLALSSFLAPLCLYVSTGYARESFNEHLFKKLPTAPETTAATPWFTGPILTPSGHVVPTGHQNYEPYVYWTEITGVYNSN